MNFLCCGCNLKVGCRVLGAFDMVISFLSLFQWTNMFVQTTKLYGDSWDYFHFNYGVRSTILMKCGQDYFEDHKPAQLGLHLLKSVVLYSLSSIGYSVTGLFLIYSTISAPETSQVLLKVFCMCQLPLIAMSLTAAVLFQNSILCLFEYDDDPVHKGQQKAFLIMTLVFVFGYKLYEILVVLQLARQLAKVDPEPEMNLDELRILRKAYSDAGLYPTPPPASPTSMSSPPSDNSDNIRLESDSNQNMFITKTELKRVEENDDKETKTKYNDDHDNRNQVHMIKKEVLQTASTSYYPNEKVLPLFSVANENTNNFFLHSAATNFNEIDCIRIKNNDIDSSAPHKKNNENDSSAPFDKDNESDSIPNNKANQNDSAPCDKYNENDSTPHNKDNQNDYSVPFDKDNESDPFPHDTTNQIDSSASHDNDNENDFVLQNKDNENDSSAPHDMYNEIESAPQEKSNENDSAPHDKDNQNDSSAPHDKDNQNDSAPHEKDTGNDFVPPDKDNENDSSVPHDKDNQNDSAPHEKDNENDFVPHDKVNENDSSTPFDKDNESDLFPHDKDNQNDSAPHDNDSETDSFQQNKDHEKDFVLPNKDNVNDFSAPHDKNNEADSAPHDNDNEVDSSAPHEKDNQNDSAPHDNDNEMDSSAPHEKDNQNDSAPHDNDNKNDSVQQNKDNENENESAPCDKDNENDSSAPHDMDNENDSAPLDKNNQNDSVPHHKDNENDSVEQDKDNSTTVISDEMANLILTLPFEIEHETAVIPLEKMNTSIFSEIGSLEHESLAISCKHGSVDALPDTNIATENRFVSTLPLPETMCLASSLSSTFPLGNLCSAFPPQNEYVASSPEDELLLPVLSKPELIPAQDNVNNFLPIPKRSELLPVTSEAVRIAVENTLDIIIRDENVNRSVIPSILPGDENANELCRNSDPDSWSIISNVLGEPDSNPSNASTVTLYHYPFEPFL